MQKKERTYAPKISPLMTGGLLHFDEYEPAVFNLLAPTLRTLLAPLNLSKFFSVLEH